MSASVEYKRVTKEHITHLANNMRDLDREEINLSHGGDLEILLTDSVVKSSMVATVFINGELGCILGVCPADNTLLCDTGIPWLIGTDVLTKNVRSLITEQDKVFGDMFSQYNKLVNYVWHKNKHSIVFLRHCGFTFYDPDSYGVSGALFHRFEMTK